MNYLKINNYKTRINTYENKVDMHGTNHIEKQEDIKIPQIFRAHHVSLCYHFGSIHMMSNSQIVENNYELIKTCCSYQLVKYDVPEDLYDDLIQELSIVLLDYDNKKLNTIVEENHLNAFITGILIRMCYSTNSSFYRTFRKFSSITEDIDDRKDDEPITTIS